MSSPPVTSRVLPIEHVFARGVFVPASVQRDYQWRTSDCLVLLTDVDRTFLQSSFAPTLHAIPAAKVETDPDAVLSASTSETCDPAPGEEPKLAPLDHYMLGAIVVCRDTGHIAIYDGLQRLTTLTILICVLRDMTADAALAQRLDALIRMASGPVRLSLHGRDSTLATQIQPRGEAVKRRRKATGTDMGQRIRVAAQAYREKLKPWDDKRRDAFACFLLEHVYMDVQEAADARLARQIFVTSNTRGRTLDAIDLLKGQLSDIAADDATAARIVAHWNGLRATLGDRFSEFLHCIDFIERAQPQGSDCLSAFADHLAKTRGPKQIEAFVAGLAERGADYLSLLQVMATPPTDALSSDIWRLQFFRWTQWRPLALHWYSDYLRATTTRGAGAARRVDAAGRRFQALHRRCMGLVLAGFSAGDRETILARAMSQAKAGNNPLASTGALAFKDVQLRRVTEGLRLPVTDPETRSTLVRWLEGMMHGDVPPAYVKDCTVEHVLPRRPPAGSDWTTSFESLDARYLACHTLGNLVALDKVRNEKLRNISFAAKLPVLAEAARDFKLLADVDPDRSWNADTIQSRTEHLATVATMYLDLPLADI
jgi:hypothetical protein